MSDNTPNFQKGDRVLVAFRPGIRPWDDPRQRLATVILTILTRPFEVGFCLVRYDDGTREAAPLGWLKLLSIVERIAELA